MRKHRRSRQEMPKNYGRVRDTPKVSHRKSVLQEGRLSNITTPAMDSTKESKKRRRSDEEKNLKEKNEKNLKSVDRARKGSTTEDIKEETEKPFDIESSIEKELLVMEEVAELPPFGFHLIALKIRLEERGLHGITTEALVKYLEKYYDLEEWKERFYAMLELPPTEANWKPYSLPADIKELRTDTKE